MTLTSVVGWIAGYVDLKKITTCSVMMIGGFIVRRTFHRYMFSKNYKTLKKLEKSYIDKAYDNYVKNYGFSAKMYHEKRHTNIDKPLLGRIQKHLKGSSGTFKGNRILAERVAGNIEIYLNQHDRVREVMGKSPKRGNYETEEDYERAKEKNNDELAHQSRCELEICMDIFFHLDRLHTRKTEMWVVDNKSYIKSLYKRHNKEQSQGKFLVNLRGGAN